MKWNLGKGPTPSTKATKIEVPHTEIEDIKRVEPNTAHQKLQDANSALKAALTKVTTVTPSSTPVQQTSSLLSKYLTKAPANAQAANPVQAEKPQDIVGSETGSSEVQDSEEQNSEVETGPEASRGDFNFPGQPEDFKEQQIARLNSAIKNLYNQFTDPKMVETAISDVVRICDEHEFLRDNLMPKDMGQIVILLRANYSKIVTHKVEKTEKKKKNAADVAELDEALASINFTL